MRHTRFRIEVGHPLGASPAQRRAVGRPGFAIFITLSALISGVFAGFLDGDVLILIAGDCNLPTCNDFMIMIAVERLTCIDAAPIQWLCVTDSATH